MGKTNKGKWRRKRETKGKTEGSGKKAIWTVVKKVGVSGVFSFQGFVSLLLFCLAANVWACDLFCLPFLRLCSPKHQLITSRLSERMQQTGQEKLFAFQGPVSFGSAQTVFYQYSAHSTSAHKLTCKEETQCPTDCTLSLRLPVLIMLMSNIYWGRLGENKRVRISFFSTFNRPNDKWIKSEQ